MSEKKMKAMRRAFREQRVKIAAIHYVRLVSGQIISNIQRRNYQKAKAVV